MSNAATTTINPTCHACEGTGIDTAFGGSCAECERDASLAQARFRGDGHNDRIHQPGERMDGRTFGGGATSTAPSEKQMAFIVRLLGERDRSNEQHKAECETVEMLIATGNLNRKAASAVIDLLMAIPTTPAQGAAVRSNSYPGTCRTCGEHVAAEAGRIEKLDGKWITFHLDGECPEPAPVVAITDGLDLRPLEAFTSRAKIRVGVPGSDSRLKVLVKFARNGTVYVDDAAVYGYGNSYGRQEPGRAYVGDIAVELAAIVADPFGAVRRYAELTSQCGICGAPLEDADSIARGMGPVCARKFA